MAKYMIREEFTRILLLQKQSNLTVTDFCRNEGYNRSQFYDRRLRFGVTDEGVDQSSGYNSMDGFAPVCINSATLSPSQPRPVPLSSKPEKQAIKGSDSSEICLELRDKDEVQRDRRLQSGPEPDHQTLWFMFCLNESMRYFLCPGSTDMRKGMFSLSGLIQDKMGGDVRNGDVYIFCNKQKTKVKMK